MKYDEAKALISVDAGRYDKIVADDNEIIESMNGWINEGATILDVGCGSGAFGSYFKSRKKCKVFGLEPNAERFEKAKIHFECIKGDMHDIESSFEGKFDNIMYLDVIEHIADTKQELILCRKFLKSNGCLIICVPNVAHWTIRLNLLAGRFNYSASGLMDSTHLRWFTRTSLETILNDAGWEIVDIDFTPGVWLKPYRYWPTRVLPRRIRTRLHRALSRLMPGLFACQIIVRAIPVDTSSVPARASAADPASTCDPDRETGNTAAQTSRSARA